MIDFAAFSGKRVLITGHTGFKGSWLQRVLELAGAEVAGLALPPEELSHFRLFRRPETKSKDYLDIRNFEAVLSRVSEFRPEIIFHLAAQPLVRESYESPRETFEVNVMGGVNLMEAVRKIDSLIAFVFITSDKAYENVEWEWGYRENDRLGGRDPYSASKGAVEIAVSSYSRAVFHGRDWGLATARAGNVIGGGDFSKDRIVPDIVRSIQAGNAVVLRNPAATRPWQHVLEPISGYLRMAEKMVQGREGMSDSYNFGPISAAPRTVFEVAEKVVEVIGSGSVVSAHDPQAPHEAGLLGLNCERALGELNWSPRWGFDETILKTASWYKSWLNGEDATEITDRQIFEYFWELKK